MEVSPTEQRILDGLVDVKTELAGIKQSVKSTASGIIRNANNIEKNRDAISKNDVLMSKWVGGLVVIMFLTNFIAYYFINT